MNCVEWYELRGISSIEDAPFSLVMILYRQWQVAAQHGNVQPEIKVGHGYGRLSTLQNNEFDAGSSPGWALDS